MMGVKDIAIGDLVKCMDPYTGEIAIRGNVTDINNITSSLTNEVSTKICIGIYKFNIEDVFLISKRLTDNPIDSK